MEAYTYVGSNSRSSLLPPHHQDAMNYASARPDQSDLQGIDSSRQSSYGFADAGRSRYWRHHPHDSYGGSTQNAVDYTYRDTYYQDMPRSHKHSTQGSSSGTCPTTVKGTAANEHIQGPNRPSNYKHYHHGESSSHGVCIQAAERYNLSESSRRASSWTSSSARRRSDLDWDNGTAVSGSRYPSEQKHQGNPWSQEAAYPAYSTGSDFLADDDELWALVYPTTETRLPVQQRLEAMAGTMALQDIQELRRTPVASRFFRTLDDQELLSNVTATPHWNTVNGDPAFALIPDNGEIATFEDLHKRKQAMVSGASSMYDYQDMVPEDSSQRSSFGEGEDLATVGVSRPPGPPQPHVPVDASPTRHGNATRQSPVFANYDDQHQTAEPSSAQRHFRKCAMPHDVEPPSHDGWGARRRTYQGEYGHPHQNHSQRQQKDKKDKKSRKDRKARREANHQHQGHGEVDPPHHRGNFARQDDRRQDSLPGRQATGRNRRGKNSNKQGQKRAYEHSPRDARNEERDAVKRRKVN
ncbi:hypothetical protein PV08_01603 [Exophiala spinifera]|uniref:Uncharacterized protein n=1 Tax=Exophiala spinifera TaxID=91928 RepID=A0A0D2CC42_9EURO|nr:uncharacterized protein PV08_01603 [Exophiala spinifera]KIW21024.1 hypothetical protein PV08_01603 [Exophiala spinifera]